MKKLLTLLLSLFILSTYGFGQYSMVELNGQTISTCYDSLSINNYTIGQTYTLTICSENTIAKHMKFSIMNGHSFPEGATLYIYDGNSTEAPLVLCWDQNYIYSWCNVTAGPNNTSGCLTLVFTSDVAEATLGTNYISCNFVCQTREVEITSTTPPLIDDKYINICWDEENNQSFPITFNAQGTYPELAYECNDATNTFYWYLGEDSVVSGLGLTSITHTFPERRGHNVRVKIKDVQDCWNSGVEEKRVRVSLPPIWNNLTTVLTTDPPTNPPAICIGSPVNACAYYSNPYWTNIVTTGSGEMVCMDMDPPMCFESMLYVNSLEPGAILTSINGIKSIDMNLAHERLGDLTFTITCANGHQVQIGNQGGGDTMLGLPGPDANNFYDDEGWLYSIMPTASQTMQEAANGQTNLPSGEYASYQSFYSLVGCPINGVWQLRLCDNESQNSGTIFGWSIRFNENVYQSVWDYTQTYTPTLWEGLYGSVINNPNNQNCMTGTYTTSNTPNESSLQSFKFTVTDNFGCAHDTSLYVTLNPLPEQITVLQNPENGILSEGTSGSITLENSKVGTNYWTTMGGEPFTEEITGTGSELSLGNNFTDGSYDIRSRNQFDCSLVQGIANFVTAESGTNKIVANVTFGTPASNFPANQVNVKLYKATTNNETIVLVAEQLLGTNGQVEFADLETGDYYLGSFIQYPDDYDVVEHIYYQTAVVHEDAISIPIAEETLFVANLHHIALTESQGSNTMQGIVGATTNQKSLTPLKDMVVVLRNTDINEIINVSVTNENGQYHFNNIADNANIQAFVTSLEHQNWTAFETETTSEQIYEINFIVDGTSVYPDVPTMLENMKIQNIEFTVFPNPAREVLYINCDIEKAIVQIFDINGKLIYTDFVFSNSEINISELVSGTYIIILSAENGKTGVQKFVKE